jgi:SUMO ligase MMS21 Smc5/6 complex component
MRQAGIPGGENANFNQQIKWLMQRAQERRDEMRHSKQSGFMKGMLETIKKEAALMKDAKIKILKYPKIDEEVELLMKWNQELIPTIRTDLPEVLKEVLFLKTHHLLKIDILVPRNSRQGVPGTF